MTKKHFNAIASILNTCNTKKDIINELAIYCKEQNNNFDIVRFKKACGMSMD